MTRRTASRWRASDEAALASLSSLSNCTIVSLEIAAAASWAMSFGASSPKKTKPSRPHTKERGMLDFFLIKISNGENRSGADDYFTGLTCQLLMLTPRLGVRAVILITLRPCVSFSFSGLEVSQKPWV